jgi:glutathione S-transferase
VPPPDLTLYGLERSVYTRIARLALEEKGVAYRLEEVEIFGPEGVPPAHRERHPFGRIPVLQHGGFVLYETAAITRYVDEAFAGPALQPAEAAQRARMQQLIGLLDAYAYRPMVWGVFVERVRKPLTGVATNEDEVRRSVAAAQLALRALQALVRPAPFLLGAQPTLADLHAYPMLRCFALAPEGRSTLGEHPALEAWLDTMDRRESVQRTRSRHEQAPA